MTDEPRGAGGRPRIEPSSVTTTANEEPSDRDDLLTDAFAAFRDETAEENARISASPAAVETRARIRRVADARVQRRSLVVRLVLPFAALLAVSGAWAAATDRLPVLFGVRTGEPAAPAASSPPAPTVPRTPGSTPPPSLASDTPPPATPDAPPAPSAAGLRVDPEEVRYRAAHEAHFVARDWPRALVAWDAYLASHPTGRFAPEARYNRALVLVRLDRRDEARAALEPFASGEMQGYRQTEARQILDALR